MAEITAAAVKSLRDRTDLPMMRCKKALAEANGDEEKAIEILRSQTKSIMDKRSDNATSEGRIFTATSEDGSKVSLVEFQCETAPVASNDGFLALGEAMAKQLLTGPGASTPEELMSQPGMDGKTLQENFDELINKIAEKFVIDKVAVVDAPFGVYIHHDGKTGVAFQAKGEPKNPEILRDVAMHIAALRPSVATEQDLDAAVVTAERDRLSEEARNSGKPENIIEKMVDGRMRVFFSEQGVLTYQSFAKDESKTVGKVLEENGLEPVTFHLWVLGS